jgi:hypothetical protein
MTKLGREVTNVGKTILATLQTYLQLDVPIALFVIVCIALFAPLIPRNTDNPQLLQAYANDEPFLTMALEATLVPPYGNPGTYFDPKKSASSELPERWGDKRYTYITYYGGAMFQIAFPVYATLRAAGLPAFPTGPIILRTLTLLAGLLSLILLYNIAKERGSRVVGLLAGIFLASDAYFLYYANFIHPDTLQVFFALVAFLLAVTHARDGDRASLIALGVFCGIVQGTKSGGPWTIPMALLAVWLGARAQPAGPATALVRRLGSKTLVLGAAALIGFFISTPYAFFDTYYARSMQLAYRIVTEDSLQQNGPNSLVTWGKALYEYIGPIGASLVVLTIGRVVWANWRKASDTTLTLGVVLCLSQFLWYGAAGKLWQVVGYLLLSFGLMAVFAFETLFLAARKLLAAASRLRPSAPIERVGLSLIVAVVAAAFVAERWYTPVSWAIGQHESSRSTVRAANDWAVEHKIRSSSVIVFDDLAYFDRQRFPNARLHGGVLKWSDVEQAKPDYIVLSSSLFGAAWMKNLIATQRLGRQNTTPFNVRLYQDLLATRSPGPTRVPGIELEAIVRSATAPRRARLTELADACRSASLCDLAGIDKQLIEAAGVEEQLRALAGSENQLLVGPELRIFRVQRNVQSRS